MATNSKRPNTPARKATTNAYLARRRRARQLDLLDAAFERQTSRILGRFHKTDLRLAKERQRVGIEEADAQIELARRLGSCGASGARKPDLSDLDGDFT